MARTVTLLTTPVAGRSMIALVKLGLPYTSTVLFKVLPATVVLIEVPNNVAGSRLVGWAEQFVDPGPGTTTEIVRGP